MRTMKTKDKRDVSGGLGGGRKRKLSYQFSFQRREERGEETTPLGLGKRNLDAVGLNKWP